MDRNTEASILELATTRRLIAALTLSAAVVGCKGDPDVDHDTHATETGEGDGDPGDGDPGDGDPGALAPTFWQDVAPIYYDSCVGCHREGGVGPFVLDSYDSAAAWSTASAMAVENRVMPPWLVTDDGSCNSWQHSRALEQEQIDTIVAWVEAGAPEGEPRDDLELAEIPSLAGATAFSTPVFVPEPEGGIFSEFDEYRCFLIDPALEQDVFLTGYHVIPGNEALVHHVLAMPVDPDRVVEDGMTNLEVIQAYDEASPDRLGWPCFGTAGEGVEIEGIPVTWAPGQEVVEFPSGSGTRMAAGNLLVVQVHYNMANAEVIGQSDSTTVELRLESEDAIAREGLFDVLSGLLWTMFEGEPHVIPPGEAAHEFSYRIPVDWYVGWQGAEQFELWGFFPHMHEYGTSLTARLLDANGEEVACVGEVPRWDFGWQLYYFMEEPIILEPGQEIEVTCTYDSRGATEGIWPGWGTHNEMCLAGLYLLPH